MHIFSKFLFTKKSEKLVHEDRCRLKLKEKPSFAGDESGAIAIILVVAIIPIILMLGAAVDYSRIALARSEAQDALDAATLAAVKQVGTLSTSEITDLITSYVKANGPSDSTVSNYQVVIGQNPTSIQVSATGSTETTFMKFADINEVDFSITSKSVAGNKTLEVVMVLDNSGSMATRAGTKTRIQALRDAAKELVEILDSKKQDEESLSFGLVPFTHMVRLDSSKNEETSWLDVDGVSSVYHNNLPPNAKRFDLFATLKDPYTRKAIEWAGCVEARPHPLDIKDTTPSEKNSDSYFIPYFHPARGEINNSRYVQKSYYSQYRYSDYYLSRTDYARRQSNADKLAYGYYYNQTILSGGYTPNTWCDMARIVPLTHNTSAIESDISSMVANGGTNIQMGTIWGLRVLSPQAPYTEGRSYDDEENIKALIIMTDGNNTFYEDYYHAYGWSGEGRISGSGSYVSEMNKRTTEACQAAKDAISDSSRKIKIFTIYFGSPSQTTASMLKSCASKDEWYKSVNNANELTTVFKNIASELSNLRLVE
nr:VWA domain-containing protein [uncultured Cohaesibacter sp.]